MLLPGAFHSFNMKRRRLQPTIQNSYLCYCNQRLANCNYSTCECKKIL